MIQIIAFIYAGSRGVAGIREYETKALSILKQHAGVLLSASSCSNASQTDQAKQPDEIHVIQFPDIAAFESYKADPGLAELTALRSTCISRTELYITDCFHEYS